MDPADLPNLAVTYDNGRLQDGAGAQLQRIYGIYALSRTLGVPYIHTPIEHLGYHGLEALQNNGPVKDLLPEYNRLFHIPSDLELPEGAVVHDMRDADRDLILQQHEKRDAPAFTLIRILLPYPIVDRDPDAYRCVKAISPFPYTGSEVFRLAIHVRRGEIHALANNRVLPNSYYVACASNVGKVLEKLGIPFVCELYTEVPTKRFEVTPGHHGIEGRISQNMTYDPAMEHLEDFDAVPNLERFINTDPIETLCRMATADALILSRSSFSYLAAILSTNCTVIYYPFWHAAMSDWLISGEDGSVAEEPLAQRLALWRPPKGYQILSKLRLQPEWRAMVNR